MARSRSFIVRHAIVHVVLVTCAWTIGASAAAAQTDPLAPTAANNPYKVLIDTLNSPAGAARRSMWHIDSAIWREPQSFVDASGKRRLVAPAYAEVHAGVPFEYKVAGCEPANPRVRSNIRVLIPRDYGASVPRRWVVIHPPGRLTEYTFDTNVRVQSPMLRRGYLVVVQNSLYPGFDQIPASLHDLGARLHQGTIYATELLSSDSGLGVPEPTSVYAWMHSRAAHVVSMALECSKTPFAGVVMSSGGSGFVSRNLRVPALMKMLQALNPAAAMTDYLADIGRSRTIDLPDGTRQTGPISSTLDAGLRFHYGLGATTQIVFPVVPPYDRYGVNFRFPASFFDQLVFNAPVSLRALLSDVDPAYLVDVDAGRVLLRDWTPAQRPAVVRSLLAELEVDGRVRTKVLKVHGTRDPQIYVQTEIEYVNKLVRQRADFQFYLVPGLGHEPSQGEELVTDATGIVRTLGRELHDLDALIGWVETGIPPGPLTAVDSTDISKRLSVLSADQFGLQCDPTGYFEYIEGLPGIRPRAPIARRCETP
jgi:hypothetical protein